MKTALSLVSSVLLLGVVAACLMSGVAVWITLQNPAQLAYALDGRGAPAVLWEVARVVLAAALQLAGYL